MGLSPKEITKVIKNTIPKNCDGVIISDRWAYNLSCFKMSDSKTDDTYILQIIPILRILKEDNKEVLFEFKTETDIEFHKPDNEEELIKLSFTFIKTAIDGFNGHIKDIRSYLTLNKTYPKPKIEYFEQAIRSAYKKCMLYLPLSDN